MAISLFLNWFKMLAVDGRIDSTDYQAFEKIYTNQMEVRQMFATAISEKDKRLIQEGEAKAWTKAEAKMKLEKEQMAKQMKSDGVPHKSNFQIHRAFRRRDREALKWLCQPDFFPSRLPTMPFKPVPRQPKDNFIHLSPCAPLLFGFLNIHRVNIGEDHCVNFL
jgi:hypothetical protein